MDRKLLEHGDEGGGTSYKECRKTWGGWVMEMFCIFTILTLAMATRLYAFVKIYKTIQRGKLDAMQSDLI